MGSVWLAQQISPNRQVVVKFMSSDLQGDPSAVARFKNEAGAASRVRSAHVVQMIDHGITDTGLPFIVMEYLKGEDLGCRLARTGRLSPLETTTIVSQVASALARAHAFRIIHRDIKPENVFLCKQQNNDTLVKILDFGTAKELNRKTCTITALGTVVGTPSYMSPEQMMGLPIDAGADVWALAVLAFEALTGRRPFPGATLAAIGDALHNRPPPRPSLFNPEIPPTVDEWFLQAVARDPRARFASVLELANALKNAYADHAGPFSASFGVPRAQGEPSDTVTSLPPTHSPKPVGQSPNVSGSRSSLPLVTESRSRVSPSESGARGEVGAAQPSATQPHATQPGANNGASARWLVLGIGLLLITLAAVAATIGLRWWRLHHIERVGAVLIGA
ncbi:MAG: hypothetical protein NVSMB1_02640 [Polyangiales bacterium]